MIEVDLNIRVLPKNHEIFYARPGDHYRFYDDFVEQNAIFLDLPGLDVEQLYKSNSDEETIAQIHRARELKDWLGSTREKPRPSDDIKDYLRRGETAGIAQVKAAVDGYFRRAKKGDLVVTTPSAYSKLAYIGELTGQAGKAADVFVERAYGREPLPGRRVRWLASIEKRLLQGQVLEISQKPNIFVTLPRSARPELYNMVYRGYTFEDEYTVRFDVTEDQFTTRDDLRIQLLFNYVAVNTRALSADGDGKFVKLSKSAFVDAEEYTPDLKVEVSSPGFLSIFSSKITPLVAAALFVIAVDVGPSALQAAKEDRIRIGNSQAPADDPCVADVQRQAIEQIILSGDDGWPEACEKAKQAAEKNGLRGPAKLKNSDAK